MLDSTALNSTAPIRTTPFIDDVSDQQPRSRPRVSNWFFAVVILVSYAGYFSGQGALGLVGPDEPRYVSIARSMERTGDWVTPRLNGAPWFEKPVCITGLRQHRSKFSEKMISPRVFRLHSPRFLQQPQSRGWLGDSTAAQQVCSRC